MHCGAHKAPHPTPGNNSRLKSRSIVLPENLRIAAIEIICDHLRCEAGEPHRTIQTSRGERRHRTRRIADEQAAAAGNRLQHSIDRNEPTTPFDRVAIRDVLHSSSKLVKRFAGLESISISGYSDVRRFTIGGDPADVAGREPRVDETVQRRRPCGRANDLLEPDEKFRIAIETELLRDERARAVSTDDESDIERLATIPPREHYASVLAID